MKIEDQVCSVEPSIKLKELGVKHESYFYWVCIPGGTYRKIVPWEYQFKNPNCKYMAAYSIAELGEMLPRDTASEKICDGEFVCRMSMSEDGDTFWDEKHMQSGEDLVYKNFHAETEADARAKMLIYLLENKLIKLKFGIPVYK